MDRPAKSGSDAEGKGPLAFLERIDTKTRGVAVLDALADMIERAGLQVGDMLPPEITLAEHLGVGRSTIREALNRWEGLGLIRRKRGAGTFIAARIPSSKGLVPTMIRLEGEALLRLLEVRRALEIVAVHKAAVNATAAQRVLIGDRCKKLLKIVNARKPWRKADADFHGAIYDASGNPLFGQILVNLDDALKRSEESPFGRTEFGLASFPLHQILCDGILQGNPDMAVGGINKIIDSVANEIRDLIASDPNDLPHGP
ncbi:MAG TPA: FadR/GntR family transcriptional regulator [Arsenicitalea sp.]|jgi:DNA-binding FadR family transcriptional regulator|nr:FadR/GntR family transcriptional regulator [Arsenicitalea sp.]